MEFAKYDTLSNGGGSGEDSGEEEITLDLALLIASATAKGIDPALWLTEQADAGIRPFNDFTSKLISLGLAVGIQEDRDTKKELDHATSKSNLRLIYRLCKAGSDQNGQLLVDVGLFLSLCNRKLLIYLRLLREQGSTSTTTTANPLDNETDLMPPPGTSDEPIIPSSTLPEETISQEPRDSVEMFPSTLEVEPEPVTVAPLAREDKKKELVRLPPQFIGVATKKNFMQQRKRPPSKSRSSDATAEVASSHFDSSRMQVLAGDSPAMVIMRGVEDAVRFAVKQSDLYHILQVYLGFLSEKYSYDPPRSKIVFSVPREWLTFAEIQHSFEMARLRLMDFHVVALYKLVALFSGEHGVEVRDSLSVKELREKWFDITDEKIRQFKKEKMESRLLKAYLIYLRITSRSDEAPSQPIPWEVWAVRKDSMRLMEKSLKPVEFEKALAGEPHLLTEEELASNIASYCLLQNDVLEQVVALQVEAWVIDADCRRDYIHRCNMALERYQKDNKVLIKTRSIDEQKRIRRQLKDKLLSGKSRSIVESEYKQAAVSTNLFTLFDKANKSSNYQGVSGWVSWLARYIEREKEHLGRLKEAARARKVAEIEDHKKSAAVAALITLENELTATIRKMSSTAGIEVRKGLINLRRSMGGKGERTLVRRGDFEKLFDRIPMPMNSEKENIFVDDAAAAMRRASEVKSALDGTRSEYYGSWKEKKDQELKEKAEQEELAAKAAVKEKENRLRSSKKVFRSWKNLMSVDKYKSKNSDRGRNRPVISIVRHTSAWNDNLDIRRTDGDVSMIL